MNRQKIDGLLSTQAYISRNHNSDGTEAHGTLVSGLASWRNLEWGFGFGSRCFDCETLVFNKASKNGSVSHAKTRIIGPPES